MSPQVNPQRIVFTNSYLPARTVRALSRDVVQALNYNDSYGNSKDCGSSINMTSLNAQFQF